MHSRFFFIVLIFFMLAINTHGRWSRLTRWWCEVELNELHENKTRDSQNTRTHTHKIHTKKGLFGTRTTGIAAGCKANKAPMHWLYVTVSFRPVSLWLYGLWVFYQFQIKIKCNIIIIVLSFLYNSMYIHLSYVSPTFHSNSNQVLRYLINNW